MVLCTWHRQDNRMKFFSILSPHFALLLFLFLTLFLSLIFSIDFPSSTFSLPLSWSDIKTMCFVFAHRTHPLYYWQNNMEEKTSENWFDMYAAAYSSIYSVVCIVFWIHRFFSLVTQTCVMEFSSFSLFPVSFVYVTSASTVGFGWWIYRLCYVSRFGIFQRMNMYVQIWNKAQFWIFKYKKLISNDMSFAVFIIKSCSLRN